MKTNFLPQNLFAMLLLCFLGVQTQSIGQFSEEPISQDFLSVTRGSFNYVLFSPNTDLDSLDNLDHALFRQKEKVEKLTYSKDELGRSQSEISASVGEIARL